MTVRELIEQLQQHDPETEVLVMDRDWAGPIPVSGLAVRRVSRRDAPYDELIEWFTDEDYIRDPYTAIVLNTEPAEPGPGGTYGHARV